MSMEDMTRMKYCLHFWASWWLLTLWALCSADWWSSVTFLFFFSVLLWNTAVFSWKRKESRIASVRPIQHGPELGRGRDPFPMVWIQTFCFEWEEFSHGCDRPSHVLKVFSILSNSMILWFYAILNLRNREQLLVALFAGTHLTKDTFELPWWASNLLRVFFLWGSRALRACQTALHFSHGIQNINHPYTLWMENCRNVLRSLTDAWS